jgi:hypothetical protein
LGGVRLTDPGLLVRTIKINLVALRQLKANIDPGKPPASPLKDATEQAQAKHLDGSEAATQKAAADPLTRTKALQNYILGLALVAATSDPDLNLREGCNLRITGDDRWALVKHRKDDEWIKVDRAQAIRFAEMSGRAFFALMAGLSEKEASNLAKGEHPYDKKDHLDARFEKDVAEEFLGLADAKGKLSGAERDKVRKIGPITRATLDEYWRLRRKREKAGDPIDKLRTLIGRVKTVSGGKKLNADAEKLRTYLTDNPPDAEDLKGIHEKIVGILNGNDTPEAKITALNTVLPPVENQSAGMPPSPNATEGAQ